MLKTGEDAGFGCGIDLQFSESNRAKIFKIFASIGISYCYIVTAL
jgi:hypothetical protein